MATAPAVETIQVIGTVYSLPIADIEVGVRLRPVDPVWAVALGQIIAQEGQQTPIQVCRYQGKEDWTWSLVAGASAGGAAKHRASLRQGNRPRRCTRSRAEDAGGLRKPLAQGPRAA